MTRTDTELLEQLAAELRSSERIPGAPERQRLLAAAYDSSHTTKEDSMLPTPIARLFAGAPPAARFALAATLLLGVLALSLLLPRGGQISPVAPAWAATDGFLLALDFGEGSTEESVKPVLEQLHAAVREFKAQHGLPVPDSGRESRLSIRKELCTTNDGTPPQEVSRVVAMVALPDASLTDELKAVLAQIPGLPTPEMTNATWFSQRGLPDPNDETIQISIPFGDEQHVFNFPLGSTEESVEGEINRWLAENKPDFEHEVDVTIRESENEREVEVKIISQNEAKTE